MTSTITTLYILTYIYTQISND